MCCFQMNRLAGDDYAQYEHLVIFPCTDSFRDVDWRRRGNGNSDAHDSEADYLPVVAEDRRELQCQQEI